MLPLYSFIRYCTFLVYVPLILFLSPVLSGQTKNEEKAFGDSLILELKNGDLLVQLQSKSITINEYRSKGYEQIAQTIEEDQRHRNRRIIEAFRQSFRFCKVYFFFSEELEKLRSGKVNEVVFVNANGIKDSTITRTKRFYMISTYSTSGESSVKKSLLSTHSCFITDQSFRYLKNPFPYYFIIPKDIPKLKKIKKKIYAFNNRLQDYYYSQPVNRLKD